MGISSSGSKTRTAGSLITSIRDTWAGLSGVPLMSIGELQVERHLDAAVGWIERARSAVGDGGISKGYDLIRKRWAPSYPETTGYTVPTLLNGAKLLGRSDLTATGLSLADHLLKATGPEGGVAHWERRNAEPVVFDTGQVIFGWLAAFAASNDVKFLQAATRAGDWLARIQDPEGCWKKNQHLGVVKVIDTRVAWALLELYQHTGTSAHLKAAVKSLEWAKLQQEEDGWFAHCAFLPAEDPVTHTLAYTAEGFLECGRLLHEQEYVERARLTADSLIACQRDDGSLAGTYARGWRETTSASCLTGDCQMASLWLRLYDMSGSEPYRTAAQKAVAYVAGTQNLWTANRNVRGGIAGSWPIYGRYERFKYPNWATKFFVDALLALHRSDSHAPSELYVG